jgi:flotillin
VIYGRVGKDRTAKCIHGGGTFIFPLIQDYGFLDLLPRPIDIDLIGALSKQNIRVNVPSTFTVGISIRPEIVHNAAERLLGLNDTQIREQAKDIILGQMRLVIATLNIEEINQDREKFLEETCHKAGFLRDAWKDPETAIYGFTCEIVRQQS